MKIGFFGGCFNPPTNAHISLANEALKRCNLDKVIFVPVGDFYEKKDLAKAEDRYNMLKLACDGIKNIEVTDIEINVREKLYTIDAFNLIEKNYPNDELYFIMGADNFLKIKEWKSAEELLKKFQYIVFDRNNTNMEKYVKEEKINNVFIIENKTFNTYSSSEFRESLKLNKNYKSEIIPDVVIDYIIENNLFLM